MKMRANVPTIEVYAGLGLKSEQAVDFATMAEAAGYDGLWTVEAGTEAFMPLTLAAEHTERVRLGTAVAVAFARNPMTTAYLTHELNRYSRGRLDLGLGTQVGAHIVARYSERFDRPTDRMAEFLQALRAIYACWNDGQKLNFRGEFYRHTLMSPVFSPDPSPYGEPRLLISAHGPKMCAVAAQHADGLIAHPLASADYLRAVTIPRLQDTARSQFDLVMPAMVITGRDEAEMDAARAAVRKQLAFYASTPSYHHSLDIYDARALGERLHKLSQQGEWQQMADLVSDEFLAHYSVEAPPDRLAAALRERYAGLVDRLLPYAPYPVANEVWQQVAATLASP